MAEPKTRPTDADVYAFLESVENPDRRADALAVCDLMAAATGELPVMWGDAIVGFGSTHLKYASGRELDWPKVGFSPRKQNLTIYMLQGFERHRDLLAALGKHTKSKSCLYIKRLSDVDQRSLSTLIKTAYADAGAGINR